jgi:hypothetical protein
MYLFIVNDFMLVRFAMLDDKVRLYLLVFSALEVTGWDSLLLHHHIELIIKNGFLNFHRLTVDLGMAVL